MKRAVHVNCDGLCPDWIGDEITPVLARLCRTGLVAGDHRAVVPSVTRVSAACVATGCMPQRHGLHGNRMAIVRNGRLEVHDVGPYGFVETLRAETGQGLRVPVLAERLAGRGGFAACSNVSAGAANFLDPDRHGLVLHRDFGHETGGTTTPLPVTHDMGGDEEMTRLFLRDILPAGHAACLLWLANPDLTLHGAGLGSPAHLDALRRTDACVGRVEAAIAERRAAGEDILMTVGSDHGQETVGDGVDLHRWAREAGFGTELADGRIALATQGTAVLVYALVPPARLLEALARAPWVAEVVAGDAMAGLGMHHSGALVAVASTARRPVANAHGVIGQRVGAFEGPEFAGLGFGQHGGWGPDESRPFLVLQHPGIAPGTIAARSSLIDIAPTILDFLGHDRDGMDGRSLLGPARRTEKTLTPCTLLQE